MYSSFYDIDFMDGSNELSSFVSPLVRRGRPSSSLLFFEAGIAA